MPRTNKLCKKRNFRGNQYKSTISSIGLGESNSELPNVLASPCPCSSSRPTPPSASSRKIAEIDDNTGDSGYNNVIVSISILSNMLVSATECKYCKLEGTLTVKEDEGARQGLACKLSVVCSECNFSHEFWSSNKTGGFFDINIKSVYGLRSIGKGSVSGRTLFGMLDLPDPPQRFERYNPMFINSLEKIAEASMIKATEETVELNTKEDGSTSRHISIGIDGTWQRRGFSSLNGVVSVSSFDTSKILDVEVLTKYCHTCKTSKGKAKNHFCDKNFEGSSGTMEVEGALKVFARSERTRNVKYKYYMGDGDSKGFQSVVNSKPYGDFTIEKLECVGHVQKRMGGRLRKLRRDLKGQTLSDGLKIGGKKGRLTDAAIDSLQNYYGLAIRRNPNDLEKMRKDVWAIFFHKASTDEMPQHSLCDESWCKYKQCAKENKVYHHKNSLDKAVIEAIKPTFKHLSHPDLLKKCLHGRTQNVNESFNGVLWSRIPKINFVGVHTLKFGTLDAVVTFNEGNKGRLQVLEDIGIKVGKNCAKTFRAVDINRIQKSEIAAKEETKHARKRTRMIRKKLLDEENEKEPDYESGMF